MPHSRADDRAEERRLLYVSVTRAKALLFVSYPHTRVVWNGGSRDEILVKSTPFIRKNPTVKAFADFALHGTLLPFKDPKHQGNQIISTMCANFKLKEAPSLVPEKKSSSQNLDFVPLERGSTLPLLSEAIDKDSDDEDLAPSREKSMQMLPLQFKISTTTTSVKNRRKSESDASDTTKKRKRALFDDENAAEEDDAKKAEEVDRPSKKTKKVDFIDLVDDDDGGFTPFHEKKKKISATEQAAIDAAARKRAEKMRLQAQNQSIFIPPKPSGKVQIISNIPKSQIKKESKHFDSIGGGGSSHTQVRASGAALPTIKPKK